DQREPNAVPDEGDRGAAGAPDRACPGSDHRSEFVVAARAVRGAWPVGGIDPLGAAPAGLASMASAIMFLMSDRASNSSRMSPDSQSVAATPRAKSPPSPPETR